MANNTTNQDYNKSLTQLQAMINDKQIISLAEQYYNLKMEMSALTRNVKEKESSLILEQAKALSAKPEVKEEPKQEIKPEVKPSEVFVDQKQPFDRERGPQQPQQRRDGQYQQRQNDCHQS